MKLVLFSLGDSARDSFGFYFFGGRVNWIGSYFCGGGVYRFGGGVHLGWVERRFLVFLVVFGWNLGEGFSDGVRG